jgi:hypothetical protein
LHPHHVTGFDGRGVRLCNRERRAFAGRPVRIGRQVERPRRSAHEPGRGEEGNRRLSIERPAVDRNSDREAPDIDNVATAVLDRDPVGT